MAEQRQRCNNPDFEGNPCLLILGHTSLHSSDVGMFYSDEQVEMHNIRAKLAVAEQEVERLKYYEGMWLLDENARKALAYEDERNERLTASLSKLQESARLLCDNIEAHHPQYQSGGIQSSYYKLLTVLSGKTEAAYLEWVKLKGANRVREDYPFRCQRCGAPHWLDTSVPSEVWNQIVGRDTPEGDKRGMLCLLCIDELVAEAGLSCEVEFHFGGRGITSKTYSDSDEWMGLRIKVNALAAELEESGTLGVFLAEKMRRILEGAEEG